MILCTALLFTHPWNLYQTISDISEVKVSLGFGQYGHWTDSIHDLLTSFSLKKSFNDVPLNDLLFWNKKKRNSLFLVHKMWRVEEKNFEDYLRWQTPLE